LEPQVKKKQRGVALQEIKTEATIRKQATVRRLASRNTSKTEEHQRQGGQRKETKSEKKLARKG